MLCIFLSFKDYFWNLFEDYDRKSVNIRTFYAYVFGLA